MAPGSGDEATGRPVNWGHPKPSYPDKTKSRKHFIRCPNFFQRGRSATRPVKRKNQASAKQCIGGTDNLRSLILGYGRSGSLLNLLPIFWKRPIYRCRHGSACGPVIVPVFKTGGWQIICHRWVRLPFASANILSELTQRGWLILPARGD